MQTRRNWKKETSPPRHPCCCCCGMGWDGIKSGCSPRLLNRRALSPTVRFWSISGKADTFLTTSFSGYRSRGLAFSPFSTALKKQNKTRLLAQTRRSLPSLSATQIGDLLAPRTFSTRKADKIVIEIMTLLSMFRMPESP